MKTMKDLPEMEQIVLHELRSRIQREFPGWTFRMTLFGSRARGDADPDSDMDVLIEIEAEQITFTEKQRLRTVLGEVSLDFGLVIATLIADRHLLEERGDFSIFENIREEGIPE
ncbi:MAG: nucleotidyltransferase domain-containing protein [candidate division NC10 bacterium]|nr:nucleotidyltransferase domain-containing protein [candidate division NC10 bacterium]MDE2321803.1 nucleotidyltransferase domain-containing protein [candidate division NC10 bacterium]